MSGPLKSAIYDGRIRHRRFEPIEREFSYDIFMLYLDLDELPRVMRMHPLWSTRPRSPARFRREDYLGPGSQPLGESVRDLVEARTGSRPEGPIRMLTHLRYWGICFNPVSFYCCFDRVGEQVETVLAEVTNTPWGEQHTYLIDRPVRPGVLASEVSKQMHVSPLMGMDHRYELVFADPGRTLSVHVTSRHEERTWFDATLRMKRFEISRSRLARLLFTRVPMPVKVLGGIHLEAARTWITGARYHPHPGGTEKRDLPKRPENEMLCPVEASGKTGSGDGRERSGH